MQNCVIIFNGDRESVIVYELIRELYDNIVLITLVSPYEMSRTHPIEIIKKQAEMLNVIHETVSVNGRTMDDYRVLLTEVCKKYNADTIVHCATGYINGLNSDWITDVCRGGDLYVTKPIWGFSSEKLSELEKKFNIRRIYTMAIGDKLVKLIGKEVDEKNGGSGTTGTGTTGDMVVRSKSFKSDIRIKSFAIKSTRDIYFTMCDITF